ncbi:MAG TPA: hypothetical protein VFB45_25060 [Pseudolabrys sp.]|nr:hypothetical protein [Pseudolabrys sp.]
MHNEQEQRYRLAAAECLERAARTKDPTARTNLIAIAQKWLDMAGETASSAIDLAALITEFNDQQMRK